MRMHVQLRGQLRRQDETVFAENPYVCSTDMRKVFFLLAFFILTAVNTAVVSAITNRDCEDIEMPIQEEDKDVAEDDDDDFSVDHLWVSKDKSSNSNLHILYQEILFHDLELEIIVPPPKA